jgi:putative membrane protein
VLSVVLGLLLGFRANTSYARYYEGRQLWQDLSSNTRNLARLIWCSIPERTQNDHLEKMRCMKLLLAFAVSTKHYLRREYGIDYYDLDYLLPPNWIPAAADDRLFIIKDDSSDDDAVVVTNVEFGSKTHLLDANEGGDDIDDLDNQRCPSTGPSSSAVSTVGGDASHQHQLRKPKKKRKHKFVSDEDLPDEGNSDMSLPLEIIFRMSLYMAQAKTAGKIDGAFSNVIITHLNNLNDCLSSMERIVNTPIPAAYVVHL